MRDQKKLVWGTDWDVLVVLDACRYDYFSEHWSGESEPVWSPASHTSRWLLENFPGEYDLKAISGVPGINSKGVRQRVFKATEHFDEVVDVWDFGWSDELGSTPPWAVEDAFLRHYDGSRTLVWFQQPHGPWIHEDARLVAPKSRSERGTKDLDGPPPHKDLMEEVKAGVYDEDFMRKAYSKNVKIVIPHVEKVAQEADGKVAITSDHGEHLGESRLWLHPPPIVSEELRVVPWVELK